MGFNRGMRGKPPTTRTFCVFRALPRVPRFKWLSLRCRGVSEAGTAMERHAYCRRPDGTIGHPHLETKGGRRP